MSACLGCYVKLCVRVALLSLTRHTLPHSRRPHRRNTSTLPVMQRKILVVVAPEVAVDNWSMCVLLDELRTLYTSQSHDATIELPLVEMQYDEYLVGLPPP